MIDQEGNIDLGKTVCDVNNREKKIVVLFETILFQMSDCLFVLTFCHPVDYLWLLLDNSCFKNLWQLNCLNGKSG